MPFAFVLAALAEMPVPRRAQGQRYSTWHLLRFSVLAALTSATSYKKIIALQRERLNAIFDACFQRAPAVGEDASRIRTRPGVMAVTGDRILLTSGV